MLSTTHGFRYITIGGEVELEELKLLVVAMVGREQGGCASSYLDDSITSNVLKFADDP